MRCVDDDSDDDKVYIGLWLSEQPRFEIMTDDRQ